MYCQIDLLTSEKPIGTIKTIKTVDGTVHI